jgi:hypothetical protein
MDAKNVLIQQLVKFVELDFPLMERNVNNVRLDAALAIQQAIAILVLLDFI